MRPSRGFFALSLLRESAVFVGGVLVGKLWARTSKRPVPVSKSGVPRPLQATADALHLAERERNARKN